MCQLCTGTLFEINQMDQQIRRYLTPDMGEIVKTPSISIQLGLLSFSINWLLSEIEATGLTPLEAITALDFLLTNINSNDLKNAIQKATQIMHKNYANPTIINQPTTRSYRHG